MEKIDIIVEVIQQAFAGKVKIGEEVNVRGVAEAILEKIDFHSTMGELSARNVNEAKHSFFSAIDEIDEEMDKELQQLGKDETLLKNFIRGQKTACEKLRETLS